MPPVHPRSFAGANMKGATSSRERWTSTAGRTLTVISGPRRESLWKPGKFVLGARKELVNPVGGRVPVGAERDRAVHGVALRQLTPFKTQPAVGFSRPDSVGCGSGRWLAACLGERGQHRGAAH